MAYSMDSHWDSQIMADMPLDWSDEVFENGAHTPRSVVLNQPYNVAAVHGHFNTPNENGFGNIEDPDKKRISDAVIYGPRFCDLFQAYCRKYNLQIDISRHLMSLCTEHLIPFVAWIRETDQQMAWVSKTLLDFDYLRPEVRNGIVMILIYTFASVKATRDPVLDMFLTLQDVDMGIGIANKFSLKIYNDPFMYLTFLKTSISALIDAGAIPDNERQNQPKRSKVQFENKEEVAAYLDIQRMLVALLDKGDNARAQHLVQHITSYWQIRGKFVRNKRFVSALNSLKHMKAPDGSAPPQLTSTSLNSMNRDAMSELDREDAAAFEMNDFFFQSGLDNNSTDGTVLSNPLSGTSSSAASKNSNSSNAVAKKRGASAVDSNVMTAGNPPPFSRSNSGLSTSGSSIVTSTSGLHSAQNRGQSGAILASATNSSSLLAAQSSSSLNSCSSSPRSVPSVSLTSLKVPVCALRFERVGLTEWEIKETQVYDIEAFLNSVASLGSETPLCLVDETALGDELQSMRLEGRSLGVSSLVNEAQQRKALVTTWPRGDLQQFRNFIRSWQEQNVDELARQQAAGDFSGAGGMSPYEFWQSKQKMSGSRALYSSRHGLLMYEMSISIGILVRSCPTIGLFEDIWCFVYPNEMQASSSNQTFGSFLEGLFPQLKSINNRLSYMGSGGGSAGNKNDITVKYFAHKRDASGPSSNNSNGITSVTITAADMKEAPQAVPLGCYQTIGTFSSPAIRVISRLFHGPLFHDFSVELLEDHSN